MKFPRNARIFRGQLDVAPFAIVFLLLVLFMMLSRLVYTPGVHLQLPVANDLPGSEAPPIAVAIDKDGRLYFKNVQLAENELKQSLHELATNSPGPLVVLVHADKSVSIETIVHLELLLRDAGVAEARLATLPGPLKSPLTR